MVLIKVIFSEVKIRLYLTCYQSYLLNKSGKFKMFWFLDLCREHLCRGHCVLLLIICLPWKPVFCHFLKPEWTLSFSDSSILWLPHHYLISNFAHAQEFCLFFLNVLISIVHFTSWCFFPGQMLSPVILFFFLIWCVSHTREYQLLHISPPYPSPSHQTFQYLLLPELLQVFLLTVLHFYPCYSRVTAQWPFPFSVHWVHLQFKIQTVFGCQLAWL